MAPFVQTRDEMRREMNRREREKAAFSKKFTLPQKLPPGEFFVYSLLSGSPRTSMQHNLPSWQVIEGS
jgi:hypothetical protein